MATSFGYGIREYNKKIPFRAPPPDTYVPDNAKTISYNHAPTWIMGRPGYFHKTNRIGQKMTEAQRENVTLTVYVDKEKDDKEKKLYEATLSPEEQQKMQQQSETIRKIPMDPYDDREQRYEEPTDASNGKVVPRMGYRFKQEGSKYYKYAFPDKFPGPGKYYDYKQHHKHFFKSAKGPRTGKRPTKGRFDVKLKFAPSPDHYKPAFKLTKPKIREKTFGYYFDEKNATIAPGPGRYNVRTKLKGQGEDILIKIKQKRQKSKRSGKKRKTKSKTSRVRTKKQKSTSRQRSSRKVFDDFAEADAQFQSRLRKTAGFKTTFGTSQKNGWYHKPSCAPGPARYDVTVTEKMCMAISTRASTALKSTFGIDQKVTNKKTKTNHQVGPGQYEELDKNILKSWIKRHSAKMLGRQKGWEKVKHNGNPGPGKYDQNHKWLKSQIKYSSGKGQRSSIFDGLKGPGPHHNYEIVKVTHLGQIPQKSRTCTVRNCKKHLGGKGKRSQNVTNSNPGPGKYSLKFSQTKSQSRQSSMGARKKDRKYKTGQQVPSPVAYEPLQAFNKLKSKSQGNAQLTGIGFPKSRRAKTRTGSFQGPKFHKIRKKIGGPQFGFGTQDRFPEIDEDDIIPGPGNYNAPSYTVTAPAYLFKKTLDDDVMFYQK